MAVRVITREYSARFSYQHFHSSLHEILAFKKFLREVFQKNLVTLGLLAEVRGSMNMRGVKGPNPVIRYFLIN